MWVFTNGSKFCFLSGSYLFKSSFEGTYRGYDTNLQPHIWSYSAYAILYVWNLVWIVWLFLDDFGILRKFICFVPTFLGSLVAIEFCFGLLFFILSIQLSDAGQIYGKLWSVTMALIGFTSAHLAVGFRIQNYKPIMLHQFNGSYWTLKIATQNGIGGLVAMLLMETFYTLHYILTDTYLGFASTFSTTVLLSALSLAIVCYFVIDILLVESVSRMVILPYLAVAASLCSTVLTKSTTNSWENVIFLVVLACACTVSTGVRILIGMFHERHVLFGRQWRAL